MQALVVSETLFDRRSPIDDQHHVNALF